MNLRLQGGFQASFTYCITSAGAFQAWYKIRLSAPYPAVAAMRT